MTGPRITAIALDVTADSEWSFRTGAPTWSHPTYGLSSVFDPFPAYPHDPATVMDTAQLVEQACPPLWPVEIYLADREEIGRTNGFSSVHQPSHRDDTTPEPTGLIMMCGKRIPPHPAMTRYLVAHEYGHNVAWMISRARGVQYVNSTPWMADYAEARALPAGSLHHGSGGTWHDSATEVFACDFRILVCGVEEEYWPHPGVPHPLAVPTLTGWWDQALADLDAARRT